jgi:protein-tyrosine-phosphatase
VDIGTHRARSLTPALILGADLCVGMAGEHREEIVDLVPEVTDRAFTLKELVRLLERASVADVVGPEALADRVAAAARNRAAEGAPNPFDEDIADPIGMPLDTYRAVTWELEGWTDRLVAGLFGSVPAAAERR